MSTQTDKYRVIHDKQIARYKKCLTIVIDNFDGKLNAFLLQNVVPALEKYVTSVHSRRGIPVPAHGKVQEAIENNLRQIHELRKANVPIVFTDIEKVAERMLAIRARDQAVREAAATHNASQLTKKDKQSFEIVASSPPNDMHRGVNAGGVSWDDMVYFYAHPVWSGCAGSICRCASVA